MECKKSDRWRRKGIHEVEKVARMAEQNRVEKLTVFSVAFFGKIPYIGDTLNRQN